MFRLKGLKILCLVRGEAILKSLSLHLQRRSGEVYEALEEEVAWGILERVSVDIAVVDWSHRDFISQLKQRFLEPKILLLHEASEGGSYALESWRSKVSAFIAKPINFAAMDMTIDAISSELSHERERKEAAIQREGVLESIKEGVFCFDTHGRITYANPAAQRLVDTPIKRLYHHRLEERLRLEGVDFGMLLERILRRESSLEEGRATLSKEGRFLAQVEFALSPLLDKKRLLGAVATFHDATCKHEKEQELKLLSLLVEQSPGNILLTDLNGKIIYVNRGFEELSGFDRDEVIGLTPRILKSHHHPSSFYREMWHTVKHEGRLWAGEVKNHRKDGGDYWVYLTIYPVRDEAGEIAYFAVIGRDITDKKAYEAYLKEHGGHFDEEAIERAARGMEQQRRRLDCMRADYMGNLLRDISHHWRQPLAAISLLAYGLQELEEHEGLDREQFKGAMEGILRQVELMSRSLDGFRDFFRAQESPTCFELRKVFEEVASILAGELQAEGISLEITGGDTLELCGPCAALKQVLLGVLRNGMEAIAKASLEGESRGRIAVEISQEGECAIARISDNGVDIPVGLEEQIFELDFSTKEGTMGRGLGLYIGRAILRHGFEGDLSYEPRAEGKGCFVVKIPSACPL